MRSAREEEFVRTARAGSGGMRCNDAGGRTARVTDGRRARGGIGALFGACGNIRGDERQAVRLFKAGFLFLVEESGEP